MTDDQISNSPFSPAAGQTPGGRKPPLLLLVIQWVIVAFFALFLVILTGDFGKLGLPGAPVTLFWAAMATVIVVALIHSPPVFFRFPLVAKVAAYAGILVGMGVFGGYADDMKLAYERTPQGAREAAAERKSNAAAAAEQLIKDRQKVVDEKIAAEAAQLKGQRDDILDQMKKLEACFTTFGHRLPALEERIKASLHNPAAFEHVETITTVPDADGYDVNMQFRAENQFGAIRTATVHAAVSPERCAVVKVSDIVSE